MRAFGTHASDGSGHGVTSRRTSKRWRLATRNEPCVLIGRSPYLVSNYHPQKDGQLSDRPPALLSHTPDSALAWTVELDSTGACKFNPFRAFFVGRIMFVALLKAETPTNRYFLQNYLAFSTSVL